MIKIKIRKARGGTVKYSGKNTVVIEELGYAIASILKSITKGLTKEKACLVKDAFIRDIERIWVKINE